MRGGGADVGQSHVAKLRMRKPQCKVSEGEVGDHLPVAHQEVQPLGIPRPKISMFPDGVRKDCHYTSRFDAWNGSLASDD